MASVGFAASVNYGSAKTSIYVQNRYSGGITFGHNTLIKDAKWVVVGHYGVKVLHIQG